ncbi:MAG: hypothetical protein IIC57_10860 [Proteobacteria bacterium]|nr:hypothetical protein [Pseudomonadota bacterium]
MKQMAMVEETTKKSHGQPKITTTAAKDPKVGKGHFISQNSESNSIGQ